MTLTKQMLAEQLKDKFRFSNRESKELVDSFFELLKETIIQGEEVKLASFGNFETRNKVARPGRNPKTGEECIITPRRVCTFRAGAKLRERCDTAQIK